jgi:soluble lytic murein transglycosylase
MKRRFSCLLLSLCLPAIAGASPSVSYSPSIAPDRFEERAQYLAAINLIQTGQFSRYYKVKPQLRTYALYPYLEYTELVYRISRQKEQDIQAFIAQHADTPLVEPLLQRWLANLAKRGDWQTFLRNYDHPRLNTTKELACQQAYALYKTDRLAEAIDRAGELWLVGHSQPDECDPVFRILRDADGLTDEMAWQRLAMSLQANNRKLSSYLLRYVGKEDKSFASNYRLVHFKPRSIKRYSAFRDNHLRNREIILHGVKRLARTDPEDALVTLQRYESMHNFDPEALEDTYASIGTRLAQKTGDFDLMDTLPVNLHDHPSLVEARLRQSIRHGDWRQVLVLVNLLPEELRDSSRWQYWKARTLAQSADEADLQQAREIFEQLSASRSWYGFISADILDQSYSFEDESRKITREQVLSLEEAPGIQRALELFALDDRYRARREWYFSTTDFSSSEREVAARVALRWGWYKAAIQSMIQAEAWNHLEYRFPIAFQDTFISHARRVNIPVQWSLAIARQESAFMPDARSSSGALGVMQLMPATARHVAGKVGVSYSNNSNLTEPELNIRLGSHYLAEMLRRFDNNRILASAAYNAGPGRVEKWLNPDVPFDVWIEIIPFIETRNYVQNVLMFSSIYSRRMDEAVPLIFPHELDYFSPRQITLSQQEAEVPPENS